MAKIPATFKRVLTNKEMILVTKLSSSVEEGSRDRLRTAAGHFVAHIVKPGIEAGERRFTTPLQTQYEIGDYSIDYPRIKRVEVLLGMAQAALANEGTITGIGIYDPSGCGDEEEPNYFDLYVNAVGQPVSEPVDEAAFIDNFSGVPYAPTNTGQTHLPLFDR